MWNFAKKFIPGIQIEAEPNDTQEQNNHVEEKETPLKSPNDSMENEFVFVDKSLSEESLNNIDNGYCEESMEMSGGTIEDCEEEQIYIKTFRPKKKPVPDIIKGTDWESVNFDLTKLECQEDEITGIEVSDSFIVAQYYIESDIDVFERRNPLNGRILTLKGHEYGGGNLTVVNDRYLYSGSMDRTMICWDLKNDGGVLGRVQDHFDYISTIFASESHVVTGGKGDKLIFVYEALSLKRKYKLEGHTGWITALFIHQNKILISGSDDKTIKTWNLEDGSLLRTYEEDANITSMIPFQDIILFGDGESKLSFLSTATGETLHLLPNILIGTGRYCRACKYHDKGIDNMFLTDNGYLITGSSGSKYVKIWKFNTSHTEDWEGTDVKELQILRDHDDYITALRVYENKIYSSCSDGKIYIHEFPQGQQHYDMAEEEETDLVNVVSLSSNGTLSEAPKNPTELCLGGFRCRTGKTGITKSSSSFMVSFQLRPAVAEVKESIRLSTIIIPEEPDEWNPDSDYDSDEYELVLETESDTEEDDKMEGQD